MKRAVCLPTHRAVQGNRAKHSRKANLLRNLRSYLTARCSSNNDHKSSQPRMPHLLLMETLGLTTHRANAASGGFRDLTQHSSNRSLPVVDRDREIFQRRPWSRRESLIEHSSMMKRIVPDKEKDLLAPAALSFPIAASEYTRKQGSASDSCFFR